MWRMILYFRLAVLGLSNGLEIVQTEQDMYFGEYYPSYALQCAIGLLHNMPRMLRVKVP